MKVFVLCDARGNVESVAIPEPAAAAHVGVAAPVGGRVHALDVDSRTRGDLLEPRSEETRAKAYAALRTRIVRTRRRR